MRTETRSPNRRFVSPFSALVCSFFPRSSASYHHISNVCPSALKRKDGGGIRKIISSATTPTTKHYSREGLANFQRQTEWTTRHSFGESLPLSACCVWTLHTCVHLLRRCVICFSAAPIKKRGAVAASRPITMKRKSNPPPPSPLSPFPSSHFRFFIFSGGKETE